MAAPEITEWCIVTHFVNSQGRVVMHCYGGYPTRSKALTAHKKFVARAKREYTASELQRSSSMVRPIYRDLVI